VSMAALLLATRDQLRSRIGLRPAECDVTEGGRPIASAGERFVAVSEGGWSSNSDESLDESFGVAVTVTVKCGRIPDDRLGPGLIAEMAAGKGLLRLAEWVRACVHSNYDILNAANALIGTGANGFVEPLRLAGPGRLRAVGPAWFSAAADADSDAPDGLVLELRFHRARRVQGVENLLVEFTG
jgi:hypothetical protein